MTDGAPSPGEKKLSFSISARTLTIAVTVIIAVAAGVFVWRHFSAQSHERDINTEVQQSMQQTFDTDQRYIQYHLRVDHVMVIKQSGNQYAGIAAVYGPAPDQEHDVPIQVTADDQSDVIWKTEPGALLFLVGSP